MAELNGLRICFIAGTLGQGGAERQLYYMLRVLLEHGAKPTVLCLTRGEYWEQPIKALGVPVIWVGNRRSTLARLVRITAAVRASGAGIVQSQHFYTNLYSLAAARALGIREIGAIRSDVANELAANQGLTGSLMLRAPTSIAVNSTNAIDRAVDLGAKRERLYFLPNVVDVSAFCCRREPVPGTIRLLAVGRLGRVKRFDRFVRLVSTLRERTSLQVVGTLVGDGPARDELRREAARLNLSDEVCRFVGSVDDLAPRYANADILVLTSEHEGTPNVVIEAMASGLPVVATRVGGLPEIVKDRETGILVDHQDESGLARATLELICNPSLRQEYGAVGRRLVEERHAFPRLAQALASLYDSVLRSGPGR
jgi:glycosyltransferase involved in cell wall biosynthesis